MGELMKKLAARVGVFSHSAVNDRLRELTPEAGGGPPPYIRAYQAKRHEALCVSATGNGNFAVRKVGISYGNRVRLVFGTDGTDTIMTCTCAFVTRFKIPCCDVIAVGREMERQDEVLALVDSAYHLPTYRAVYADEKYQVLLPVPEELTVDTAMQAPRQVEGRAGRPTRGPAQTKRFKGRGDKNASSSFNVPMTPTSGTTAPMGGGGAGAGNLGGLSQGASALSQGAPDPSQGWGGLTQRAPGPSQVWSGLPQAAPGSLQGWGSFSQGAPSPSQWWGGLSQGRGGLSQGAPGPSQGSYQGGGGLSQRAPGPSPAGGGLSRGALGSSQGPSQERGGLSQEATGPSQGPSQREDGGGGGVQSGVISLVD